MADYKTTDALAMAKQAADYAETDKDFVPLRKWLYELGKSVEEDQEELADHRALWAEVSKGVDRHPADVAYDIETAEVPQDMSRQVCACGHRWSDHGLLHNHLCLCNDPRTPTERDRDNHARETEETRRSDEPI